MLSYVKTFAMQIVPSVAATIIGAYIVNHYIVAKPAGSEAPAAASVSAARSKVNAPAKTTPETKPADAAGDVANLPEAGVKAKGISEKALLEKNASAEKAVVEKSADKVTDKTADKPAETASIPAEPRRHTPAPREKTAVRVIPLTAQPAAPAPVVAAPAATFRSRPRCPKSVATPTTLPAPRLIGCAAAITRCVKRKPRGRPRLLATNSSQSGSGACSRSAARRARTGGAAVAAAGHGVGACGGGQRAGR